MHPEISQITRKEILSKLQARYARAGQEYKTKLIDEVVELFGYHRKAALRAPEATAAGRLDKSAGRCCQ